MTMHRVVLDTASFIAALRSHSGAASEVLRMVLAEEVVLLMDLKLSLEYRSVSLRPEHVAASRYTRTEIIQLLQEVEALAEAVEVTTKHRPLSPDPDDDMVLDVAINGRADTIVSNNVKHFIEPAQRFRIDVNRPAEFLKQIAKEL